LVLEECPPSLQIVVVNRRIHHQLSAAGTFQAGSGAVTGN